jgi:hypothetical protein
MPLSTSLAERRKRWLKRIAMERMASWRVAVLHPRLDGVARLETTRELICLRDGVCTGIEAHASLEASADRSGLLGTKLVGWITTDNRLVEDPIEGARALFWRYEAAALTIALAAPMVALTRVMPLTLLTGTRASVTLQSPSNDAPRTASSRPSRRAILAMARTSDPSRPMLAVARTGDSSRPMLAVARTGDSSGEITRCDRPERGVAV